MVSKEWNNLKIYVVRCSECGSEVMQVRADDDNKVPPRNFICTDCLRAKRKVMIRTVGVEIERNSSRRRDVRYRAMVGYDPEVREEVIRGIEMEEEE